MTRSGEVSPRLKRLQADIDRGETGAVEAFWREVAESTAPMLEPVEGDASTYLVTFLWRAVEPVDNVVIAEWLTGGDLPDKQMTQLGHTDVWYRTLRVRSDVRAVYRIAPNDPLVPRWQETDWPRRLARFEFDPLNPKRFLHSAPLSDEDRAWVAGSILELPDAPKLAWSSQEIGLPAGSVERHRFASTTLKNERNVWLYRPSPFAARGERAGLLILFDGDRSLHALDAAAQLDRLIADGAIRPLVMAIVGNTDRNTELPCNPAFVTFLADELTPWVRKQCSVSTDPRQTILAGQSYGGLAAVYGALERPDVFGNALSQSGSFWWKPDPFNALAESRLGDAPEYAWLCHYIATRPSAPVRMYMEAGTLENRLSDGLAPSLLSAHRHMRDVLIAKGYDLIYREFPGGHDYLWWRGRLADGLIALAGSDRVE